MTKPKSEKPQHFEKALENLEKLVRDLESGEKNLDDSLAMFEEGVLLARELSQRLDEAKTKVDALSAENGKLSKKPFPVDD